MTNDEIKRALRTRCLIIHRDPKQQTVTAYSHAQAWRVSVDKFGAFISSLELVGNNTVTIALAEECEIAQKGAGT